MHCSQLPIVSFSLGEVRVGPIRLVMTHASSQAKDRAASATIGRGGPADRHAPRQ